MYFHITPPFHSGYSREAGSDHLSIQVDARWWVMLYEKRGSCGEWVNRLSENRQTIKQGGGQEGAFEKERSYLKIYKKNARVAHWKRRFTAVSFIMMLLCSDHEALKPKWEDLTPPRHLSLNWLQFPRCTIPLNHSECISLSVFESFTSLAPEQHRDEAWS